MTERKLPAGLEPERTTSTFTADSVPPGLLRAHHTTVWAELVVEAGTVVFVEEDPHWQVALTAPARQAIVPNRKHHVEPLADALFRVQFYCEPK